MDDAIQSSPPRWFTAAAIAALLFELAGCVIFAMQITVDAAALPPDQRVMWAAAPTWMPGALAVAVGGRPSGALSLPLPRLAPPRLWRGAAARRPWFWAGGVPPAVVLQGTAN